MSYADQEYLGLLAKLVEEAETEKASENRTDTNSYKIIGHQMRFDLSKGFPLLTTKKTHLRSIIIELLWFLSGNTNNKTLTDQGCTIWNEWATIEQCYKFGRKPGDLGPIYGHQWRNFGFDGRIMGIYADGSFKIVNEGFDQIKWLINEIKTNPNSRRLIVSGWNPQEAGKVALPPCHTLFQFFVKRGKLSCQLYQRSADTFLGVPFNIASYALLTHMVAQVCNLEVGEFIWVGGDVHLYENHLEQAKLQLNRNGFEAPTLKLNPEIKNIFSFTLDDISLENYESHPGIAAKVAI